MPPKPTCKVVKRAGQRGARIHPKGCTVRTNVDVGAGTKVRTNKAGEQKRKVVVRGREHQVTLARAPNAPVKRPEHKGSNLGHIVRSPIASFGEDDVPVGVAPSMMVPPPIPRVRKSLIFAL